MQTQAKKTINRVKDAIKRHEGPARKDQSTSPIADAIRAFWKSDRLSFSILQRVVAAGGFVQGASDPTLQSLRVVAQ